MLMYVFALPAGPLINIKLVSLAKPISTKLSCLSVNFLCLIFNVLGFSLFLIRSWSWLSDFISSDEVFFLLDIVFPPTYIIYNAICC